MIPWWVAVVALFVGALFGFVLLGIVIANDDK